MSSEVEKEMVEACSKLDEGKTGKITKAQLKQILNKLGNIFRFHYTTTFAGRTTTSLIMRLFVGL